MKGSKEKELEELKIKIVEQEKWELEIAKSLCHQLLEEYDGSLLNHNWFKNKGEELEFIENKKQEDLENIQKALWEKSLNKVLNKEEYFVPNQDVFKIKEEIKSLGIHVETGVEFLDGLNKKEKEKAIENFPEILYSLIIANIRDWELIEKNIDENLFLNNLVPIYIRQDMNNTKKPFKNFYSKAYELIEMENYNFWRENINNEIDNLDNTMSRIKEDLKNINKLQQELIHISRIKTAFLLNKEYRQEEKEIIEILEEIRIKEEEKSSIQNKVHNNKNNLEVLDKKLSELGEILNKIESYIWNLKEFKEDENRILAIKEENKNLDRDINSIQLDNENIRIELDEIKDSFRNWEFSKDVILKEVKIIFPDLEIKYNLDDNYSSPIIPNFETYGDLLLSKIHEREILDKDIYAKNHEIQLIDKDIENLFKEMDRYILELNNIDKNWESTIYLEKSLNEINIEISALKRNIRDLEKTREDIKSNLNILDGSIMEMKRNLTKTENFIIKKHNRPPIILEIENILDEIDKVDRDIASNEKFHIACIEELDKNSKLVNRIEINFNRIKGQYELDIMRGKKDKILKEKLDNNIDLVVDEWFNKFNKNKRQIDDTIEEGEKYRNNFLKIIDMKLEEDRLKKRILDTVKEANIINFKNNFISFTSMKAHFQNEILSLSKDKEKAEEAMVQWTHRASIHVIRMVEALKDMVNSMNYINEAGHSFPLVKLKGEERLPKEESEITHLLEEYFISTISNIIDSKEDIENLDNRELNKIMGDGAIFSKAIQGRYPTLLVYKMSEKNEFKYARPRDEYYATWEAIMKGEGYSPEGSGGQTLSVTTFLIMMIMSFKKKHIGNENPSTVLILDNPFGKASGKHVLDPIFEIADKLNFQLISFAAPEIIKAEISERFPVFWDLKIEEGKVVHGGRIILVPGTDLLTY